MLTAQLAVLWCREERSASNDSQVRQIDVAEVVSKQKHITRHFLDVLEEGHVVIVLLVEECNHEIPVDVRTVGVLRSVHDVAISR